MQKALDAARLRVAVVGASGLVGQTIVEVLSDRAFPLHTLELVASPESEGAALPFRDRTLRIRSLDTFDFANVDLAFFAIDTALSERYVPKATDAGCLVIDNSRAFRMDPAVPLVVPEINAQTLTQGLARGLFANPNCSTIALAIVLKCLDDLAGLKRVEIATYQSVSGAGRAGLEGLSREAARRLNGLDIEPDPVFSGVPIAFNVIPQIDDFEPSGYTREEMKLVCELRKILDRPTLEVNPTAVRVPVFYGHAAAVHARFRDGLTPERARKALEAAEGVRVIDQPTPGGYPTPVTHGALLDEVFVGRIRQALDTPQGINLWVVSDNVRKGAALNAVQIAERLVKTLI
ncbi:aspartate-semialdehyde dehydrogenase [mine drainage metagenome]|uniref:aspartate-semialdehyde dehydrogenase n=4 Tax=mine drainage metagenome TaxID=410659 RepID=T1C0M6_9ZZZZ